MRRKYLHGIAMCLLGLGAWILLPSPAGAQTAAQTMAQTAPRIPIQAKPQEKPRIAILPPEVVQVGRDERTAVAEEIRTRVVKSGTFVVVDRTLTQTIQKEWETQQVGITEDKKAVKIGKLYNVKYIITGKLNSFGDERWQLSVVLLDAETGIAKNAETIRHRGEFFSFLDTKVGFATDNLLRARGAKAQPPPPVAVKREPPRRTVRAPPAIPLSRPAPESDHLGWIVGNPGGGGRGVVIRKILDNTTASGASLKEGDRIISIDKSRIKNMRDFQTFERRMYPNLPSGKEIVFLVSRQGQLQYIPFRKP